MTISKIKEKSLQDDAVTSSKVGEDLITGQTELSETAASSDVLLIYDASTGTLKKIQASNVGLQAPTISSVSPTNILSGDGTGNATFTITGTGFTTGATASLITDSGSEVSFDSVTRDSSTQITGVIAVSSLSNANEPYDVKVTLSNSLTATLTNQINIDAQPVFNTASGSLGSARVSFSGVEVNATDPDSAGNVTFELQSGSLPPGISLTNTGANGGTATFTGTISPLASSDTVYNFTLRAVDAASNVSSRAFSLTASGPVSQSFTSSGTFSVPSGVSSVDVLVVGGGGSGGDAYPGPNLRLSGGGGAGGLVFMPGYPVTPGGTLTVTVGAGGNTDPNGACAVDNGDTSSFGSPGDPGLSPTGEVLNAVGGGYGARIPSAAPSAVAGQGGSGGGGSVQTCVSSMSAGSATQPTQPGNSGAYGFGNNGGPSSGASGGGGGGAGAVGQAGSAVFACVGGEGGIGKAYTIADGTTPVYYAGGGGGGSFNGFPAPYAGNGGQGGGGPSADSPTQARGVPGQANKGGGGGGSYERGGGNGGKGIVIVRY